MPEVDVVLVSHDHYDHLGEATVRRLGGVESMAGARWVTSLGVGEILRRVWGGGGADYGAGLDGERDGWRSAAEDYGFAFAAFFGAADVQSV